MEPEALFLCFEQALAIARRAALPAMPAAVARLRACQGLVLATGAGKSGLAARKLAATLATAGRRAAWLDPGAAAHGEQGMLRPEDLLVAISRSGESDEVVELALRAPCPLLAVTSRPESRLGRAAALVLPIGQQSDPRGPPSASFLATVAVLDVLALCAQQPGEPVRSHPAGALGRAHSVPVGRVMHPPPGVAPQTGFQELLTEITRCGLGAVLLVQQGRLAGIVTDGDLRRAVERLGDRALGAKARDIACLEPVTVRASAPIGQALALMEDRPSQISVLPVLDERERVVGLVRIHDLVQAGLG